MFSFQRTYLSTILSAFHNTIVCIIILDTRLKHSNTSRNTFLGIAGPKHIHKDRPSAKRWSPVLINRWTVDFFGLDDNPFSRYPNVVSDKFTVVPEYKPTANKGMSRRPWQPDDLTCRRKNTISVRPAPIPIPYVTLFLFTTFHESLKSPIASVQYARKVFTVLFFFFFFSSITTLRSLTRFHSCFAGVTHARAEGKLLRFVSDETARNDEWRPWHACGIRMAFFFFIYFSFLIHVKRVCFCPISRMMGRGGTVEVYSRRPPTIPDSKSSGLSPAHTPT